MQSVIRRVILPVLILLSMSGTTMSEETGIFKIPVFNYVTGKFDPSRHPLFVDLKKTDIPVLREGLYLRKEAAAALSLLLMDFKKDNPGITISLVSATRNFYSQKVIWEEKWSGKRRISGASSVNGMSDPIKKAELILRYSSMPGTSRHHWGTDFDINRLNNGYYSSGEGKIIYDWLSRNAARYGFCQPYTAGRASGYREEKWHWSYTPLSKKFLAEWNSLHKGKGESFWEELIFAGSKTSAGLAPLYVNSINPDCR